MEAWLCEVYPQIKARAGREGALILWQDESGVRLAQLMPKAGYAPRGVRAVAHRAMWSCPSGSMTLLLRGARAPRDERAGAIAIAPGAYDDRPLADRHRSAPRGP